MSYVPPSLPPPQHDPTEELVRIDRRRKAVVRQRRRSRIARVFVVLALGGVAAGGFLVGREFSDAPGPQLKTSDRGLARVTVTDTVAARTVTVVTRGTP
ncbi:MAG TPA: hypothetical protein VGK92_14660 [Gaiellales bacterium]